MHIHRIHRQGEEICFYDEDKCLLIEISDVKQV